MPHHDRSYFSSLRRGFFAITDRGKDVLSQNPTSIDRKFLEQFPEFLAFQSLSRPEAETNGAEVTKSLSAETPMESLEAAYERIRAELKSELVDRLKGESPALFERIVIELLVKMGYGGSRADAGQAIGKSGDEGLDGIIKEDRLGLDIVHVQAKRWSATVGRPEIQSSLARCTAGTRVKGFSSPPPISREKHTSMCLESEARSYL